MKEDFSIYNLSLSSVQIYTQQAQNICITFVQGWTNVEYGGQPLYKCYTNVLCLLGRASVNDIESILLWGEEAEQFKMITSVKFSIIRIAGDQ